MQRIPLHAAKAGMILAQPLLRQDGMTLAGVGYELTDTAIERFQQAGVAVLSVEGGGDGDGVDLEKVASDLPRLFRRHENNQFMMALHTILAKYFARRIADKKTAIEAARLAKLEAKETDASSKAEATAEATNGDAS